MDLKIVIPNKPGRVLEELPFACLVGGCVRDALLGYPPKDLDIEVYQTDPDDLVKTLERAGKVDQVGKSFGVIKLTLDGQIFDFSLPRRDSKLPEGGHKPNSEIWNRPRPRRRARPRCIGIP